MITSFRISAGGTIYRTATGLQGYYSRVLRLSETEFLASFVASAEIESPDSHVMISRSFDGGASWQLQGPVDSVRSDVTETGFISREADGGILCTGARWMIDADNPDLPLVDPKTVGMRENEIALRRSRDNGASWTPAEIVPKPLPVSLEIATGIATLSNGTKMLSCATWKQPDGECPYGHRIVVMKSSDGCKSWSRPVDVFYDPDGRIGYWEGRVTERADGVLLATCWAHDWRSDADIPNQYALSYDQGESWTRPMPMPVMGQTGWPLWLSDDLVLFVYNHRRNPVGVRGVIVRISSAGCKPVFDAAIFEPQLKTETTISGDDYAVTGFQFGAPSAISIGENKYMVVYWCVVQGRSGIDWTIIEINE